MQIVSNDAISTYETMREWTRFDRGIFCEILSLCRKMVKDAGKGEVPKVIDVKVWNVYDKKSEYIPSGRVFQKHVQGYLSFSCAKGYNEMAAQNNLADRVIDSHGVVVVFTSRKRG